jgi:acyl-coenzyme A thioesterase PaaI-like protein
MDLEVVKASFPQAVPMVGTLSLGFVDLESGTAVMRLPDQQAYRNHVGGPHAGAMFTLGESASGALVLD